MYIQKMLQGGTHKADSPAWGLKVVVALCVLTIARKDEAPVLVPGFVVGEVPFKSFCRAQVSLLQDRSETAGPPQGGHRTEEARAR